MAFLFKSKKNASEKSSSPKDGVAGSQSSLATANGKPQNEKGAVQPISTTPSSSVNNPMNSLAGGTTATPSPEQANGRRGPSSDTAQEPNLRNGSAPPVQQANPNTSLYPWSQRRIQYTTSHPSPFPRYGAAVNATASKEGDIYLMGGLINSSTVKGDLWMVEAGGTMTCYPLPTTGEGPGPRVGHASLLVGNAFIVFGGDTKMEDSDVLDETLYLLNTSTRQWSRAVPAGPRPSGRYGHSLNILGSKIYIFGGQVEGYFMNDLVAFDLNQLQIPSNRWELLIRNSDEGGPPSGKIPPARTNHSVVTYNEKLYLFGGTNGFQWFNDVWCYDPIPNAWAPLDCIGYIPVPREGHAAAIVDDVMYIFGGRTEDGADLGDLAAFRITTRRWYTFQNMGPSPSPRSGHSMTAYGKNVIVLAGEPSTATEAQDLAIVYMLDTSKIRYPNDQQIQQTPAGERVTGARWPSTGEKGLMGPPNRGLSSREGPVPGDQKRLNGPPRESVMGPNGQAVRMNGQPGVNGNDMNGVAPGSAQPQGPPGSKLPRASMAQAPPGPPPQQTAPTPRANDPVQNFDGRSKSPGGRAERRFGPPIDTSFRNPSDENVSKPPPPAQRMSPKPSPQNKESPPNGRQTPTQQQIQQQTQQQTRQPTKPAVRQDSSDGVSPNGSAPRSSSKTRQARQQSSVDSTTDSSLKNVTNRQPSPPQPTRQTSNPLSRKGSARTSQTVALLKELDAAKNRNAWYASELELARKAGYSPNPSTSPALDQRAAESFDDDDKPLIEALLAMRAELANVQGSIDKQAVLAAKQIAEVEKQRDAAVSEAVYAKARLAAQGGSQSSTPQPDSDPRDVAAMSSDRSSDISRRLATALSVQQELKYKVDILTNELEAERQGRGLAENIANTAQRRITDLESYKQHNSAEVERLKAELHGLQKKSREEAVKCGEAVSAAQLLRVEKEQLESRHREVVGSTKEQNDTFGSLREAIAASLDRGNLLERKINEERMQREKFENKLNKLKAEHELRTSDLESTTRRLRDAEELAEKHASEARKHRQAVLSGLDKVAARDTGTKNSSNDERAVALQGQVQAANELVRKYQAAADTASEKLRSAEERIAGLEAYQEQTNREGMSIRKQLQGTMREVQSLQAANTDIKHQLANQQLETNAAYVQHSTLKDILVERGISPTGAMRARGLTSPQAANMPNIARVRDLEQQLAASVQAHEGTKRGFETQQQEAEKAYREKLTQLESDYQSAVHYVKGTEKMLKRMKEELQRYKTDNERLKSQLMEAEDKAGSQDLLASWESERANLNKQIESLQAETKSSLSQMERQLAQVRTELSSTQEERDHLKQTHTETQRQLSDLTQLQRENTQLEQRAQDAEQKVSLLLDQVEHSVDNYRRQSRQVVEGSGAGGGVHSRKISNTAGTADSASDTSSTYNLPGPDNRTSMALDSLASELETLRTHWETTNKNYRLSSTFEFDDVKTPKLDMDPVGMSDWRRRLDAEESESGDSRTEGEGTEGESERTPVGNGAEESQRKGLGLVTGGKKIQSPTNKREMSPSGKEVTPTKVGGAGNASGVNVI